MIREDYYIAGMDCAEEVGAIEKEFARLSGIESAAFDVLKARMSVTYRPEEISREEIRQAVARAGLRADKWAPGHTERRTDKGRVAAMTISGILLFVAALLHVLIYGWRQAFGLDESHEVAWWIAGLYTASAIAGAWYVVPRAVKAARALRPDMNLLMTVAVIGAVIIGEWFEAATVAFLFSFSLALERWSVSRAQRAVEALMTLTPDQARTKQPDETGDRMIPVNDISAGTIIIVLPGERIPLDGIVVRGSSWVNQAPVTGESLPVSRAANDEVFAGSINGDGALEIRVTRVASDSLLAQVARLIEEARLKRSNHERWVDSFARVYTPIVLMLAIAIFLFSPLFGVDWSNSFYNALVLLVIACPCALVISTPVSIVAALASAARQGVLIKSGFHVETPARLRAIAFDKTGTITHGQLRVSEIKPLNGHTEAELLKIAAALEQRSTHPLARAICDHADNLNITATAAEELQNLPGEGARGIINGTTYWIGSHRFLAKQGFETPEIKKAIETLAARGATVVAVGNDRHICGFFGLSDDIHPEARQVIDDLHHLGVKRTIMMTGDNQATAESIARQAGIQEVHAELMPGDKSRIMEKLVSTTDGPVAMVGDGINDGPAMAAATVGIAMGGHGTDVAIETSDIVLVTDNLQRLPWLIRHGRRTVAIIKQNIFLALFSKAVFTVMAAFGLATLWMAIMADMGVSLIAVLNAMRILRAPR